MGSTGSSRKQLAGSKPHALEDRLCGHVHVAVSGGVARHAEPDHGPAMVRRRRDPAPAVALRRRRHGRGDVVVVAKPDQRLVEHDRVDDRRAAALQKRRQPRGVGAAAVDESRDAVGPELLESRPGGDAAGPRKEKAAKPGEAALRRFGKK